MKKLFLLLTMVTAFSATMNAQRIVFVDTERVLESMPAYQEAQKEIDQITQQWQEDIQRKYGEIDEMYRAYQAEEVLLTDELRQQRQDEIIEKEKQLKEYQKKKFGYQGDLYKKRQDLVKPIQDQIYEAISTMAKRKAYDIVLDKSSGVSILFANDEYDKTCEIMEGLGLSCE